MKITKKQLRRIVKEVTSNEKPVLKEFIDFKRVDEQMKSAAADLGSYLGGRPDVAKAIKKALEEVYPQSAKALYDAYEKDQSGLDQEYDLYYP